MPLKDRYFDSKYPQVNALTPNEKEGNSTSTFILSLKAIGSCRTMPNKMPYNAVTTIFLIPILFMIAIGIYLFSSKKKPKKHKNYTCKNGWEYPNAVPITVVFCHNLT